MSNIRHSTYGRSNRKSPIQQIRRIEFATFEPTECTRLLQTLGPDYTFPKVFGALNPNTTSELLHPLRLLRYSTLKVKNTPFFAILGVILYTVRKFKKPAVMENSEVRSGFSNPKKHRSTLFLLLSGRIFFR